MTTAATRAKRAAVRRKEAAREALYAAATRCTPESVPALVAAISAYLRARQP